MPHDLPLHSGFSGCLFDVELRAGRIAVALQRTQPATGRSVGQCGTSECHEHACQHSGACLHHGATYTYALHYMPLLTLSSEPLSLQLQGAKQAHDLISRVS